MQVKYVNEISIDDYNSLRKSAGWREVSNRKAEIGLKNSIFIVVAIVDKKPIGMARIVGDGGYFALIVDVVVLPQWQEKGNRETFYEQFGFKPCPDSDLMGTGMYQYIYSTKTINLMNNVINKEINNK